eukprot:9765-Heterococcus_DN1.PRE.3
MAATALQLHLHAHTYYCLKGVYKPVLLALSTAEVAGQLILRFLVCVTAGVGSYIRAAWQISLLYVHTCKQTSDGHFDSVYRDNVASTHTSWPKYQQCLVLHSNVGSNSTTNTQGELLRILKWQYSPSNLYNSAIEHRFLRLYIERVHCCIGI